MHGHVTPLMIPIALGLVSSITASAQHGLVGTVIEIGTTAQAVSSSNVALIEETSMEFRGRQLRWKPRNQPTAWR